MESHSNTELSVKIKLLHQEVAQLLKEKKSNEQAIEYIISRGYEKKYAETVIDNVREDAFDRKSFWKTFFYGVGFLIGGIALSLSSRLFAISAGAMFYFVFWGMVVAGISIIIRAFIIFRK